MYPHIQQSNKETPRPTVFSIVGFTLVRTAYPNPMGDDNSELFLEASTEELAKKWIHLFKLMLKVRYSVHFFIDIQLNFAAQIKSFFLL